MITRLDIINQLKEANKDKDKKENKEKKAKHIKDWMDTTPADENEKKMIMEDLGSYAEF